MDDVEVAVHLDVRRPGAVSGERFRRGVVRRPRGHLLELAVLALREEAESTRSDQGEVHAVIAVPVQRKQGLRRGPRPGRIPRKREPGRRITQIRASHRLAVGGDDHRRRVLAAMHYRDSGRIDGPCPQRLDRLRQVGEPPVRRRRGRRRRRHPQKADERRRDLLCADADHGQVLAEGRRTDQHVAEQLRHGGRPCHVAGGGRLRQAIELGQGQLRPRLAEPGQPLDRVADDVAVRGTGGPPDPLKQHCQVLRAALQDILQPAPRLRQVGLGAAPLDLLREGEPGPHVVGIERRRPLVLRNRLLEPPAEAGELALQEGDLAAVRRQRVGGLQRDRSALVVAHAYLGDGQIAVDGRLSGRQLARPHELIAGGAEQAHLERRQAPVEDAHRLPVLGRAGRRHPRGCAGDPIPRTRCHDSQHPRGQRELPPAGNGRPERTE